MLPRRAAGRVATPRIRNSAFTGARELLRDLGLDPEAVIAAAHIDPAIFSDPEGMSPVDVGARLLGAAVRAGADDFGLLLAERRRIANWGVLATVAQSQPTLRAALEKIAAYMVIQVEAMRLQITEAPEATILELDVLRRTPGPAIRQSAEMAVAVLYRNMREIMGEAWAPSLVCFRHSRPAATQNHQRVFGGAVVAFDQLFDGLVIETADLDRSLPGADAVAGFEAERAAQALAAANPRLLSHEVLETVTLALPEGGCSRAAVAELMGLSVRTLQRRLAEEGVTFAEVLDDARRRMAQVYVEASARPLAEVAAQLGFQSQAAFNHWHRARFGESPGARRRRISPAA
ncbi:MAG: AraC family transcriptional regulator [Pseudomonadota bacterium]